MTMQVKGSKFSIIKALCVTTSAIAIMAGGEAYASAGAANRLAKAFKQQSPAKAKRLADMKKAAKENAAKDTEAVGRVSNQMQAKSRKFLQDISKTNFTLSKATVNKKPLENQDNTTVTGTLSSGLDNMKGLDGVFERNAEDVYISPNKPYVFTDEEVHKGINQKAIISEIDNHAKKSKGDITISVKDVTKSVKKITTRELKDKTSIFERTTREADYRAKATEDKRSEGPDIKVDTRVLRFLHSELKNSIKTTSGSDSIISAKTNLKVTKVNIHNLDNDIKESREDTLAEINIEEEEAKARLRKQAKKNSEDLKEKRIKEKKENKNATVNNSVADKTGKKQFTSSSIVSKARKTGIFFAQDNTKTKPKKIETGRKKGVASGFKNKLNAIMGGGNVSSDATSRVENKTANSLKNLSAFGNLHAMLAKRKSHRDSSGFSTITVKKKKLLTLEEKKSKLITRLDSLGVNAQDILSKAKNQDANVVANGAPPPPPPPPPSLNTKAAPVALGFNTSLLEQISKNKLNDASERVLAAREQGPADYTEELALVGKSKLRKTSILNEKTGNYELDTSSQDKDTAEDKDALAKERAAKDEAHKKLVKKRIAKQKELQKARKARYDADPGRKARLAKINEEAERKELVRKQAAGKIALVQKQAKRNS